MDELTRDRLGAQLLGGEPAASAEQVAARLLAIQSQDLRGARLAVRARSAGLTATDVDRALSEERSLLVSWLNRGTLHMVRAEDYPWLHALTAPRTVSANTRRLAEEGVAPSDSDRGVEAIAAALGADGPQTRAQLRDRLNAVGVRTDGQALVHLLMLASFQGRIIRGPVLGAEQAFALVADWLPAAADVDRSRALAELARRYLAGHGPAADRDLARWAGVTLGDARAGLGAIADELEQRPDGLLELCRRSPAPPSPPGPRLLGPFDPLLHGWESREPIVGRHRGIVTSNGVFRPFALVDGRAVAIWKLPRGRVELEPLEPIPAPVRAALESDAAEVERFLAG